MPSENGKLSIREKLGYGLGDCAANFVFQTQMMFLMNFYTDVFGITAATVSVILLVSQCWDAINDLIVGAMADRTKSRWGKYRPWILLTALPLAMSFILVYSTPNLGTTGKIIWACVTYNLLLMTYTANNVPYAALTGVITRDSSERIGLTSWRFVLAMSAAFVVQTFTLDLVKLFGGENRAFGYQATTTVWAALAVVFLIATFFTTKERVQTNPMKISTLGEDVRDLLRNRTWIALSVSSLLLYVYLSMRGGIMLYYFQYYLDREDLFGRFNGVGMISAICGIYLSKPLAVRFGKRKVYVVSLSLSAALTALFYVLPADGIAALFSLQIVFQVVFGTSIPLIWAMVADVADLSEQRTGRRAIAMVFAATLFAFKLGSSVGNALSAWLLDAYGYEPNVEQTAVTLHGIRMMVGVLPAIALLIGVATLYFYEIDRQLEMSLAGELSK